MDTGLGSSTPSLADIQDHVEDDTGRAVRGIPREQQLEDIAALFSRFSNFESIILDQLQSFKKGMERLQESQDELKKSVTAEYDELTKQIEELKVTVTELQESSLVSLPIIIHAFPILLFQLFIVIPINMSFTDKDIIQKLCQFGHATGCRDYSYDLQI